MLESSIIYTLIRTLPESLCTVSAIAILIEIDIERMKLVKIGGVLGILVFIIRMLPITFGIHTIFSILALMIISSKLSDGKLGKSIICTLEIFLALVLSEGLYLSIATRILKLPIKLLMSNTSILGAILTLPSLAIFFLIVIIIKEINKNCFWGKFNS